MTDGTLLLTIVILLAILAVFGPYLFGAVNAARPKKKHPRSLRQFPTFPIEDGDEEEGIEFHIR